MSERPTFVPYDIFCKMHNVKGIENYSVSEMDIARSGRAMNRENNVFALGDEIKVNGKKGYIVAFAGYDDDYFGAIVRILSTNILTWTSLDTEGNTRMDSKYNQKPYKLMKKYNLYNSSNGFIRGSISIDIYEEEGTILADVFREVKNDDWYNLLKEGLDENDLEKYLAKLDKENGWNKYAKTKIE